MKNTESIIEAVMVTYTTQDHDEESEAADTEETLDDSSKANQKKLKSMRWVDNEPAFHARSATKDSSSDEEATMLLEIPANDQYGAKKFLNEKKIKIADAILVNHQR